MAILKGAAGEYLMPEPQTQIMARKQLKKVLDRVFFGQPKGYSVVFTEYRNPNREPDKRLGPISEAFKDVLNGTYSDGIGKDVIFETPSEAMSILRETIGKELPHMKILEYVLPAVPVGYIYPVIIIKK